MPREYRRYEPDQTLLFPPSLRDWLPEEHLAFFISDTVDALDVSAFEKRNGQRQRSASKAERSGPSRPQVGPESGGGRGGETGANGKDSGGLWAEGLESSEKALLGARKTGGVHRRPAADRLASEPA